MANKNNAIKVKRILKASANDVYAAFTHATALTEWLCNVAEADGREGGRLYLWWNSGYYASGEYTSLAPGERIGFSWHGRNEPGITQVKISLKPQEDGSTLLTLTHARLGGGKTWQETEREYRRGWKNSLDNLQSILDTGIDLRFVNRPMFGLSGAQNVDAEQAAGLGFPARAGLLIEGVMDDMGAAAAGLQSGDLLVRMGGKKITNYETLVAALQRYHAGEMIKFVAYRKDEKISAKAQLSARPLPEIPASAEDLAEAAEKSHKSVLTELSAALQDATPQACETRSAPDEWNTNENLAHLIAGERDLQAWISSLIEGQENPTIFHSNLSARLNAIVAAYSTPGGGTQNPASRLLTEYKRSLAETTALLRALPPELSARKGAFWRLSYQVLTLPDHIREHIQQIQSLLVAQQSIEVETQNLASPPAGIGEQE